MKDLPKNKDAGIRKLPNDVQEKMGYDIMSQERSMMAGGSRPMHQASTTQIDPMTGQQFQANAPAMGNFGGAMGMSNVPMYNQSMSPGAMAQSRAYKTFQTDSLAFNAALNRDESGPMNYIKNKYPINLNAPASEQPAESVKFYKDFKQGYNSEENAKKAGKAAGKFGLEAIAKLPQEKMFGSESLARENKSYEDAVKSYDDSTKAGYNPTYPKMSDHFHAMNKDKPKKPGKRIVGSTGKGTMSKPNS